jgi:hypothetical protein
MQNNNLRVERLFLTECLYFCSVSGICGSQDSNHNDYSLLECRAEQFFLDKYVFRSDLLPLTSGYEITLKI